MWNLTLNPTSFYTILLLLCLFMCVINNSGSSSSHLLSMTNCIICARVDSDSVPNLLLPKHTFTACVPVLEEPIGIFTPTFPICLTVLCVCLCLCRILFCPQPFLRTIKCVFLFVINNLDSSPSLLLSTSKFIVCVCVHGILFCTQPT